MAWGSKANSPGTTGTPAAKRGSGALSYIGGEVTLTGNIGGGGDIHLDGNVDGDVSCNTLILGAGGRVRGNIKADKATLGGSVDGTVSAASLTVEKSARITGDLSYDTISIENGAQVDGRMMRRNAGADKSGLTLVSTATAAE
ncbi:MAG: polymer-forming cytoskeletal protein [Pseudomonadota bacterium]